MLPKIVARRSDDTTQACLPWSSTAVGEGATDQATPSHFAGFPHSLPPSAARSPAGASIADRPLKGLAGIDFAVRIRRRQHRQLRGFTPLLNRRGGDDFVARMIYLAAPAGLASPTRSRRGAATTTIPPPVDPGARR